MYYSFRKIDSYNTPIRIILARRGLGKTFGGLLKAVKAFAYSKKRFVYIVETSQMIKTLSQNRGEKFFAAIKKYLKESKRKKDNLLYQNIFSAEVSEETLLNKIQGGTIFINGETAGYIVSLNDFANLKRNNFTDMKYIIVDEFIPEIVDKRNLQNTRKLISIVQSIARTQNDVIIYMFANTIRLDDNILIKMGLTDVKKGEIKVIKDNFGALIACHYVNNSDYEIFENVADKSVSGRLAFLLDENNLDKNNFNKLPTEITIPDSPKINNFWITLFGVGNFSVRIYATNDKQEFYIYQNFGNNKTNNYCINKKYIAPNIIYEPKFKEFFDKKFTQGKIFFENIIVYNRFKVIMQYEVL